MGNKEFLKTKGFYLVTFLFVLLILQPLDSLGQGEQPEKTFKVEIKDNLISVDVQDADISEVLKEIERGTGVWISIGKELTGKKITANFENLDVEDALKTILSDHYYVSVYSRALTDKEKYILNEVKVEGTAIGSKPYKGKMIAVEIPYGSGKGEVGVVDAGEGAMSGPPSFTVDEKGNIYILDPLNKRIQIFSSHGGYLSSIPLKTEACDIAVDEFGFIYIYHCGGGIVKKLYQYKKDGSIVSVIDVDERRWEAGGKMHIINNEIYVYACDSNTCRDFIIGRTLNNVLVGPSVEELKKLKEKGKQGISGNKYMTGLKRFEKGELEIKDRDDAIFKIMTLPLKEIFSIEFLGEVRRGSFFIKTERGDENKKLVVEVHKFNTDGDYLSTIHMSESKINFWSVKNYEVGKDGTIYEFLPEKEKLRLNIFPSEGN